MRMPPRVLAAAAAILMAPFTVFATVPPAQALPIPSCSEQLAELQARLGAAGIAPAPLPPGMAAQCDTQQQQEFAKAGQQPQPMQKPAAPPPPPSGPLPCTPASPGVNGNCGFTYAQCAVGALTGVGPCPAGNPGVPPPAAPQLPDMGPPTPPAAPPGPNPADVPAFTPIPMPGGPPLQMDTGPVANWTEGNPADCANAIYAAHFNMFCATAIGGPYPLGEANPYENGTPLDNPILKHGRTAPPGMPGIPAF
jgi:hypothetical protein